MEINYEASPFGSADLFRLLNLRLANVSDQPKILEPWEFQEILKEIAAKTKTQFTQRANDSTTW